MEKKFTFIDLFAGIGGFRIPFDEIGGECVFSSEWDKYSKLTYYDNFKETPHDDIKKILPSQIPPHDLLLAGFPCQPFSHAGHGKGYDDIRGTAFHNIRNIANFHKPKVILLENVRRFKTHDNGNTYKRIVAVLEGIKYKVTSTILNTKDFGVPQSRARIYIAAFQNQEDFTSFSFPEPTHEETTVESILDKNPDSKYTISDLLWKSHQERKERNKKRGAGFGYGIVNSDSKYTRTLTARYYKDGAEILVEQKDNNPRKLTINEARKLQGFPKNFEFPVSDVQAYKQLGNAVSVNVIKALAESMRHILDSDIKKEYELDKQIKLT